LRQECLSGTDRSTLSSQARSLNNNPQRNAFRSAIILKSMKLCRLGTIETLPDYPDGSFTMPSPSKRCVPKTLREQYTELQNLREQIFAMEQRRDCDVDEPLSDSQDTPREIFFAETQPTPVSILISENPFGSDFEEVK
jgi:hypothetical protein